ncbi:arylsulfatase [Falsihalocynthiibacter arcticus]|nr:arylsulfatase [Falsihalocynthiibacter arcticus]
MDLKSKLLHAVLGAFFAAASPVFAQETPNVVFILADNVGFGDMGPYGGGELRGMPTPITDQLAREGLTLTQFLVEPSCTPSRAALMTGQYSIRNGLSLFIIPGTPNTLPKTAFTMGQLFKDAGYSTAIYGKWHLGIDAQSLPSAHGFDTFYGIPPNTSWDSAATVPGVMLSHSAGDVPEKDLIDKGPWIMEQKAGGELKKVKPFTLEERAKIDVDLTQKSVAFIKEQAAAKKPFFLYLPFSMGHSPNLPSKDFAGKSRIGEYGDKIMEGDHHVGQVFDALKEAGVDDNTIVVFASDNGPTGLEFSNWSALGAPDMGSSGPFRGRLGAGTEGSIRTFAFIRWPGHVKPNTDSYAMFSIMDFLPTFAAILGKELPKDRPIDGVDQTKVLTGESEAGARETLLSFIGADLVAARWKQWRIYFKDEVRTGSGHLQLGGADTGFIDRAYPSVYNIEMDPHEDVNVGGNFIWAMEPALKAVMEYEATLKDHPNPKPANVTNFGGN